MGVFGEAEVPLESREEIINRTDFEDSKLFWKGSALGGNHYRNYKGELVLTDRRLIAVKNVMGKTPELAFALDLNEINQVGIDESRIFGNKLMLSSESFRGDNKERKIKVDDLSGWKKKIQEAQSKYSEKEAPGEAGEDPLNILKTKFAKGKISEEEFERKKELLEE